ncbi:MAG: permease prefix domain 1-containing protein [Acutalibacteraceae bacterium]|nr:permease prefix domain 1-containing protein [Acutalibacteraceae bacterium]
MNEKLRAYVEELFKNAPKTKQAVEIKEEILRNSIDRYNDLLKEGRTPEAAYNISVAGIGDVSHLIDSMIAPVASSGYTREEIAANEKKRTLLLAVSVAMYILSVIPPIICDELRAPEFVGVTLFFVIIAVATALIIYRNGIKLRYDKSDGTMVEDFKEWNRDTKERRSLISAVNGAVWALTLVTYFLVSFLTGAWYISWLIFIIGGAVTGIVKAIFDLTR